MRTFYLRFHVYAIEIMAFLRNVSSYLPMLLVSLYANSLYAKHFFRSLSIAYNEVHLYFIIFHFTFLPQILLKCVLYNICKILIRLLLKHVYYLYLIGWYIWYSGCWHFRKIIGINFLEFLWFIPMWWANCEHHLSFIVCLCSWYLSMCHQISIL